MDGVSGPLCQRAEPINSTTSGILGNASLLEEELSDEGREIAGEALEAVDRVKKLARQVMSLGRNERRSAELSDVGEHIRQCAFILWRMNRSQVTLEIDLTEGHNAVRLDPGRLDRFVSSLVNNGSHAMSGVGTLLVQVSAIGGRVSILLQGSGAGIRPENVDHIFEPLLYDKVRWSWGWTRPL